MTRASTVLACHGQTEEKKFRGFSLTGAVELRFQQPTYENIYCIIRTLNLFFYFYENIKIF